MRGLALRHTGFSTGVKGISVAGMLGRVAGTDTQLTVAGWVR